MFLTRPFVNLSILSSLLDREVTCSASDIQGLNFESCLGGSVISPSSGGYPGPIYPVCAQMWPKARLISFLCYLVYHVIKVILYSASDMQCVTLSHEGIIFVFMLSYYLSNTARLDNKFIHPLNELWILNI